MVYARREQENTGAAAAQTVGDSGWGGGGFLCRLPDLLPSREPQPRGSRGALGDAAAVQPLSGEEE